MPVLDDIAVFVATTAGLGTVGTDVFKGIMPPTPDVCAAVYEYGGLPPDYALGTAGISQEYPRVQIVVRGAAQDYDGPRDRAETAYQAIAAVANTTVNSVRYQYINPLQAPFFLKRDENDRVYIAFNVEAGKDPE